VGAANPDIRNFDIIDELDAVISDMRCRAHTRELEAAFEHDLKDCHPFHVAEYRQASVVSRLRGSMARMVSPLL
jgi:hypothetical protein